MIILQSTRLYVRRYVPEDLDSFYLMNSDPELMRYIRPPKNFEEARNFLKENIDFYTANPGLGRWALVSKLNDYHVGSLSLLPLEQTSDIHIGYVLLKPYWGLGYATEIVETGIRYAFDQLQLKTLTGVTYPENIPSQKVLLRNGFAFERSFYENGKESRLFRLNNPNPHLNPVS